MNALWIKTNGTIDKISIDEDVLSTLQYCVGGYVQCVDFDENISMWCNEDGIADGLPINNRGTDLWYHYIKSDGLILGDIVLTGPPDDNGYTTELSLEAETEVRNLLMKMV